MARWLFTFEAILCKRVFYCVGKKGTWPASPVIKVNPKVWSRPSLVSHRACWSAGGACRSESGRGKQKQQLQQQEKIYFAGYVSVGRPVGKNRLLHTVTSEEDADISKGRERAVDAAEGCLSRE